MSHSPVHPIWEGLPSSSSLLLLLLPLLMPPQLSCLFHPPAVPCSTPLLLLQLPCLATLDHSGTLMGLFHLGMLPIPAHTHLIPHSAHLILPIPLHLQQPDLHHHHPQQGQTSLKDQVTHLTLRSLTDTLRLPLSWRHWPCCTRSDCSIAIPMCSNKTGFCILMR